MNPKFRYHFFLFSKCREMNILMLGKNSRCLFNAIRRVLQGKEKATASIVYETIWSWFLKYFDENKAGVMEAIHKGEYARKLMNPNGKKDISYRDALTLNPSLLCQGGFEEALSYCELDNETMKSMIADFKRLGIRVRPSFAVKDILLVIKDHLECVVAREKGLYHLLQEAKRPLWLHML